MSGARRGPSPTVGVSYNTHTRTYRPELRHRDVCQHPLSRQAGKAQERTKLRADAQQDDPTAGGAKQHDGAQQWVAERVSQAWKKVARTAERSIESPGRAKRKAATEAAERSNKEARGPVEGSGREKRKATADATERSQKQARAAETAKGKRDAEKRKRTSRAGRTVVTVRGQWEGRRQVNT